MIKPEINIGGTTVTLLCTIKDIKGVSITKTYVVKEPPALFVELSRNGEKLATVTVDNRDEDIPIDGKTVYEISSLSEQVSFYGIQCKKSTLEDVDAVFGEPKLKGLNHCTVFLGDNFTVEFGADETYKTIYEISLYKSDYLPNSYCGEYD